MAHQPVRVCVVGSANMDLTFHTLRLPRSGETLAGQSFHMGFGGKGANQAVMACRLGAQTTMVAKVGNDAFGEMIIGNFRKQGIDATYVTLDPANSSGVASIVVDGEARNCIIVIPGANLSLSPQDIRDAAAAIQGADVLLCQLEVPIETTLAAFRLAKAAGVRTILNPAPALALPEEVLGLTDLCVPNETELELLAGQTLGTLEEVREAGQTLLQRGPQAVIVTLGDSGALLIDKEGAEHCAAVPVAAVDSTGAGDAFIGSLAVALVEGLPLHAALDWANRVAAISVTRHGTQAAFPTRAEIVGFLKEMGLA